MSDYGFKISLPGYDIDTATPEQCIIHSGYPCIKTKLNNTPAHFGNYDLTWGSDPSLGETEILSVAHGLGYTPFHLCLIKVLLSGTDYRGEMMPWYTDNGVDYYYSSCNSTHFKIMFHKEDEFPEHDYTGETATFKYQIFVEDGS